MCGATGAGPGGPGCAQELHDRSCPLVVHPHTPRRRPSTPLSLYLVGKSPYAHFAIGESEARAGAVRSGRSGAKPAKPMAALAPGVVEAVPIVPGEGPATGADGQPLPCVWGFSQQDLERAQEVYEQHPDGPAEQQAASGGPQRRERARARASSPRRQRRGRAEGGSSAPAEMAAGFTSGQYVAMQKPSNVEVLPAAQHVKTLQKATGVQPAGQRAGNRNLYAQGWVQQVHAIAEQMREHHIMQSVQLPDMVSSCKQLYDVAMGNQAELGPDMTRLKVLRCARGSPMPVLNATVPMPACLMPVCPMPAGGAAWCRDRYG